MNVHGLLCVLALGAVILSPAWAQPNPEERSADSVASANGAQYAQQNCATCHAVGRGAMRSPNPQAPSFPIIASMPGMTAIALNALLHTPHRSMPALKVDPDAVENLAAYMRGLRDPALTRQLRKKQNVPPTLRPLGMKD